MADLWWMRVDIAAWLKLTQQMTDAMHSAFTYLVLASWSEPGDTVVPACSLPNDDERLARMAKVTPAKWRSIAPELRRLFLPMSDRADRLRSPIVWSWYQKDQARHVAAVTNGTKGGATPTKPGKHRGRPRGNSGKNSGANSGANSGGNTGPNSGANSAGNSILRYSEQLKAAPDGAALLTAASDDAPLTPSGVASPTATSENGHGPAVDPGPEWHAALEQLRTESHGPPALTVATPDVPPEIRDPDVIAKREAAKRHALALLHRESAVATLDEEPEDGAP
jgi:uncharacterized protein YdaU (DUF1376 family)